MGALTTDQKKSLAKELYIQGTYTYAEIADKIGSTRQTVSRWAADGRWDELKTYMTAGRESILKGLYSQMDMINQTVIGRGRQQGPDNTVQAGPTANEADRLVKLANAIRKMENDMGISSLIDAGIRFGEFLRRTDLEKAREFVKLWDVFLTEQMK